MAYDLSQLIPSISPLAHAGVDPDEALASGDPYGMLAARKAGVAYAPRTVSPMQAAIAKYGGNVTSPPPALAQAMANGKTPPADNAPNPVSETATTPVVPSTVTPSGKAQTPWSETARKAIAGQMSALDRASQAAEASPAPDINKLEQERSSAVAGAPNPNDPQYRPSAGRRIARGVLGALAGLGEGGIKGALVGGIMPQVTTGTGYNAPSGQFSARARANAEQVANLDQQIATAEKEAQTGNPAVKDPLELATQYGTAATEAAKNDPNGKLSKNAGYITQLAKAGMVPVYDDQGNIIGAQDNPESEAFKGRVALDNYRQSMQKIQQQLADIKAQGITPGTPAWNQKQQQIAAEQERANAYLGNYFMRAYGTGLGGNELPGMTENNAGTPVGTTAAARFTQHEQSAAQFNDVYGALDSLDAAARALNKSGERPDDTLIAAALAQPKGTATKWVQGQLAKSNLDPAQRDYVVNMVSAAENIQALRKSTGGSVSDSQVDRLEAMMPNASTPDLDYFLRQTEQIRNTAKRLSEGIPNVQGGHNLTTPKSSLPPASVVKQMKDGQYLHGPGGVVYQKTGGRLVEVGDANSQKTP